MAKLPRQGFQRHPRFIVFIDRDDGTEWVLQHKTSDPISLGLKLRISLNDNGLDRGSLADYNDKHVYIADDGLNLGDGGRLFVRGGRLGLEETDNITTDGDSYTRVGVTKEAHQVKRITGGSTNGAIVWEDTDGFID